MANITLLVRFVYYCTELWTKVIPEVHPRVTNILRAPFWRAVSALLDLGPAHGFLDAGQGCGPIDLIEHAIDVTGLGHNERALAVRDGLVERQAKAARRHVPGKPNPALAIVQDLRRFVVPGTALCDVPC